MVKEITQFDRKAEYFTRLFDDYPRIIREKERNLQKVADLFQKRFGEQAAWKKPILVSVPNRVELLGKHTDYQGGTTLLLTGPKNFFAIALPAEDGASELVNADPALSNTVLKINGYDPVVLQSGVGGEYTRRVVERLSRNLRDAGLPPLRDVKAVFIGDVPFGGGTSGSSAKVITDFFIFTAAGGLLERADFKNLILQNGQKAGIRLGQEGVDDFTLALSMYIAHYENGLDFGDLKGDKGVGTFGGSEDHTAILLGERNRLLLCRYCPTEVLKSLNIFKDHNVVVSYSGKKAQKTKEAMKKYNRLSALAVCAVETLNRIHGTRFSLLRDFYTELDPENRAKAAQDDVLYSTGDKELSDRVFQFYAEEFLIKKAVSCLGTAGRKKSGAADEKARRKTGRMAGGETGEKTARKPGTNTGIERFGELITASHELSKKYLKNIEPEIDRLVRIAIDLGAIGSTGFGAGFGGSCYAVVPKKGSTGSAEDFARAWEKRYLDRYPEFRGKAQFDEYPACSGARIETLKGF